MGDAGLPPLQALPTPRLTDVSQGIFLLEPLSRLGHGPGMIILTSGEDTAESAVAIKNYVPSSLIKWAEEGYAVVQIQKAALADGSNALKKAIDALDACQTCDKGNLGVVAYDINLWEKIRDSVSSFPQIKGAIIYSTTEAGIAESSIPSVQHLSGKAHSKLPRTKDLTAHDYPTSKSQDFAYHNSPEFDYSLEAVAHTRNLTFFKRHDIIGGPIFDLEAIWDEHTYFEFENRSVAHTMATMVQEPYVNHIPTMTGGIGRKELTEFYTNNFIYSNPDGTELELISRTVGIDRIVDEFIFKLQHTKTVDWLLPSVPPTGAKLEIPMMAVVNIRGDRLYHEHISWDSGTVLRQVGLLPEYLPWSKPMPDKSYFEKGKEEHSDSKTMEFRLPVAGAETANKMREKSSVQSNQMFDYRMRHV